MATAVKTKKQPLTNRKTPTKKGSDEVSTSKLFHIPVHLIDVEDGFNTRLAYGTEKFDELRESIKANGVRQPIQVVPHPKVKGRYLLRQGHRRMKAVELLGKAGIEIKKVPAFISYKENPEEALLNTISSNDGKPLENIELGLTFERLQNYEWTVKQISEKTGYSENKIYYCLSLTKVPKKYHNMMANGTIQDSLVVKMFRLHKDDPSQAEKELEKAITKANKAHEKKVKEVKKEAAAKGEKAPKKTEIKKAKVTAKHLSPKSAAATPFQKLEEVIIKAEKKPDIYDQKKVLLLNTIFQIISTKGPIEEIFEVLRKGK